MTDNIIELNRDVESAVIQASWSRTPFFKDEYKILRFVHLADAHDRPDLWNRMVEYVNHYKNYIDFVLHTGDYCGNNQTLYCDFYKECTPCERVIYNCIGNHDTVDNGDKGAWTPQPKEKAHALLFNHTENWDADFLDVPHSMSYSKDFPESKIRLIVIDDYFHKEEQCVWLKGLLDKSLEDGYYVVTAMHETTAEPVNRVDTTFSSIGEYEKLYGFATLVFEDVIADFIDAGGKFVANLCGHYHHDLFGYTKRGVLNIAVECATAWQGWCDGQRIPGTRTFDAFNFVAIDVNLGTIKLVRIGDNYDNYARHKGAMCYDFVNKKLISNN